MHSIHDLSRPASGTVRPWVGYPRRYTAFVAVAIVATAVMAAQTVGRLPHRRYGSRRWKARLRAILILLATVPWYFGGAADAENISGRGVSPPDAPSSTAAAAGPSSQFFTVEAAVAVALRDNPGLQQMHARAQAMAAIPSQAGTLPDPAVSFGVMNLPVDTFSLSREPMTQIQIGIDQMIPYPGKLALRAAAASGEADAAESDVSEARLRLVRDVKREWWALFYLERAIETVRRNQGLLRDLVDLAQTKYKVGQGLQQDVLLAQVELSKLLDLEISLQGMRRVEEARLDALLNRTTDTSLVLPSEIDPTVPGAFNLPGLVRRAEDNRPLLASLRHQIDTALARRELAERDYYPDFSVGAGYGFRRGGNPDTLTLGVSATLPIYTGTKQDMALQQRLAEVRQSELALDNNRRQVREEIATALADLAKAREQIILFKTGIIPQAKQTVDSMRAGYLVNKVDFLNLVRAEITLYDYETQYWKAVSEAQQAAATLVAAVGEETIDD